MATSPLLPPPSLPSRAFLALLVAALPELRSRALRLTRSAAEADDLVQETAARALSFAHRFTLGTNFRAWAQTLLVHAFIHDHRRQRRREALVQAGRGAELVEAFTSRASLDLGEAAWTAAVAAEASPLIGRALAQLSLVQRQVVEKCDLGHRTYAEAAQELGWPLGTVMSRLHRARRQLKGFLAPLAAEMGVAAAAVG